MSRPSIRRQATSSNWVRGLPELFSFVLGVLILWVSGVACGPKQEPPKPRPSLLSQLTASPAFETPARWDYHPQRVPELLVERRLESGASFFTAKGGERWLVEPDANFAQVSASIASEQLLDAIELGDDGWLFIGESGTTFETADPLGPILRANPPPERLVRIAVTKNVLLGVSRTGHVLRSEDYGNSWAKDWLGARAIDVALLESGAGLVLTVPERLKATSDFGVSWQSVKKPRFGAVRLRSIGDRIQVESVLEPEIYLPTARDGAGRWRRGRGRQRSLRLGAKLPLRPSAEALLTRQAVALGERYVELRRGQLLRGFFDQPLESKDLDWASRCSALQLAGRNRTLYAACALDRTAVAKTVIYRSADSGDTWQREPYGLRADHKKMLMAVVDGGDLVVSGLCALDGNQAGCAPHGVYYRTKVLIPEATGPEATGSEASDLDVNSPEVTGLGDPNDRSQRGAATPGNKPVVGKEPAATSESAGSSAPAEPRVTLVPSAVPALRKLPVGLVASADGQSVLMLGARTKGDSLVVFFSDDRGRTFRSTEVEGLKAVVREFATDREPLRIDSVGAGEDGYIAVAIHNQSNHQRRLLVVDEAGQIVNLGQPPDPEAHVSGVGLHALAYSPSTHEVWESVDGGVTWATMGRSPATACIHQDARQCQPTVACHRTGCVLADRMSRIGWRGQVADDAAIPTQLFSRRVRQGATPKVPISCVFPPDQDWVTLPSGRSPSASQSVLGTTAWYTFAAGQSNVTLFAAPMQRGGRLKRRQLFPALRGASAPKLYSTLQIEGVAALRSTGGKAEVAWANLIEEVTPKAELPARFAGRLRVHSSNGEPDLVSIASGGLFARAGKSDPTYFIDSRSKQRTRLPSLPGANVAGRSEMVRADGESIAVRLVGGGAGIVRSRLRDGQWRSDAATVGLIDPAPYALRQRFDIAYIGERAGYHLMHHEAAEPMAWLFPFSGGAEVFAETIDVPNQSNLAPSPGPCSAEVRRQTPRLVVPPERSTRHPVIVTDSSEPIGTMLTDDAVLFGTRERPCVAMFEAIPVQRSGSERLQALVSPHERGQSWLFRQTSSSSLEYRPLDCRFDPQAPVPLEVYEFLSPR